MADMPVAHCINGFKLDAAACSDINAICRFYQSLGRPMSRSAVVRRALGLLASYVEKLHEAPPELTMVEMLTASSHARLRPASDAAK